MYSHICQECGKPFLSRYSKTKCCSSACASKLGTRQRSRKVMCTCEVCGKVEERSPSHAKHRFCSIECKGIASRTVQPRICPTCGIEFVPPSNHGGQLYCSNPCSFKSRQSRIVRTCPVCEKPFVRRGKRQPRYCSKECMAIGYSSPFGNRRPHNFTNAQRKAIKARDNHRCVKCGSTDRINVDHIIPVGLGGQRDIQNGQTLCHACHVEKTNIDTPLIRKVKQSSR